MGKLDIAKLAQRLADLNKGRDNQSTGIGFISIKDGRNMLRILPGKGDSEFAEEVWVHYGVGKNEQNKNGTMVVCPTTKNENAACPVCELSKQLKSLSKKKDDNYDKQAKSFYRKKRVYFNAIDRSEDLSVYEQREEDGKLVWYNKTTDEKESPVKVLGQGIGVYKAIIGLIVDPEYGDITDSEEGLDLIITKTGSGQFNTNYDVKTVRKESPIGFDKWEESLHDLKQLAQVKTYDEIASIMDGNAGGNESSDDDSSDNDDDDRDSNSTDIPEEDLPFDKGEEPKGESDLEDEIKQALAARKRR